MKSIMNKQLYNFIQDKIQKNRQGGQIKNSALVIRLYQDYHFGQFDLNEQWLTFSLDNIISLSEEIQAVLGLDIRQDPYPAKVDRDSNSAKFRNEKDNSYSVSNDFILVNSLFELHINQTNHQISAVTSLGIYLKATDVQSVEHTAIVLVENLTVMANLHLCNLNKLNADIDLSKALWLYRGDVKPQHTTNCSYKFFRSFKGKMPLICFSDLDPKGIEIALTSGAEFWLTLDDANEVDMPLLGNEQEWYEQADSITYLTNKKLNIEANNELTTKQSNNENGQEDKRQWQQMYEKLQQLKKTLKQEHMLKHELELTLIKI